MTPRQELEKAEKDWWCVSAEFKVQNPTVQPSATSVMEKASAYIYHLERELRKADMSAVFVKEIE